MRLARQPLLPANFWPLPAVLDTMPFHRQKYLGLCAFSAYHGLITKQLPLLVQSVRTDTHQRPPKTVPPMEDHIAEELVTLIKKQKKSEYEEAFERAFELTKAYAGSANAQASTIPFVFEKLFELFVTGKTKS